MRWRVQLGINIVRVMFANFAKIGRAAGAVPYYSTYALMTFQAAYRQQMLPCLRMTPTFLVRGNHLRTLSTN